MDGTLASHKPVRKVATTHTSNVARSLDVPLALDMVFGAGIILQHRMEVAEVMVYGGVRVDPKVTERTEQDQRFFKVLRGLESGAIKPTVRVMVHGTTGLTDVASA